MPQKRLNIWKGLWKVFKVVVKFKPESNWRNYIRQFLTIEEAEAFLNEKWNVWPVSCAWLFRDDAFVTKFIFKPSVCRDLSSAYQRMKSREYNSLRSRLFT